MIRGNERGTSGPPDASQQLAPGHRHADRQPIQKVAGEVTAASTLVNDSLRSLGNDSDLSRSAGQRREKQEELAQGLLKGQNERLDISVMDAQARPDADVTALLQAWREWQAARAWLCARLTGASA